MGTQVPHGLLKTPRIARFASIACRTKTVAFIRAGVGAPRVRTTKEVSMNERRELSHEEITHVAYGLYLERGCEPGRDIEDWLKAEKVLRNGAVLQVGKTKAAQAGSN